MVCSVDSTLYTHNFHVRTVHLDIFIYSPAEALVSCLKNNINPLAPELFFLILAHPVYKM